MPKAHPPKQWPRSDSDSSDPASLRSLLVENPSKFLCFVLAVAAVIQAWESGRQVACMDYYQFWAIGQVFRQGNVPDVYSSEERQRLGDMMWQRVATRVGTDPRARESSKQYQAGAQRQILETYSTPFLYSVIGILSTGDYDRDQDRFQFFGLTCLVLGVTLLCRLSGYTPVAGSIVLVFFLAVFGPTASDVNVGNVGRIQIGLIALVLWLLWRNERPVRHLAAGFVLGLAVLLKPNLVFVALTLALGWAASRQLQKLLWNFAGMAAGACAAFWFSAVYIGSWRQWPRWIVEMPRLMSEYNAPVIKGNFALSVAIEESTGVNAAIVISLLVLALAYLGLRRFGRERINSLSPVSDMRLASVGCLVSLLAVRMAWLHYYLLALVPILYLLRPAKQARGEGSRAGRPILRALAVAAAIMVAAGSPRIPVDLRPDPVTLALITGFGALLLTALLFLEFSHDLPSRPGR
jgi:hypothetical protein